ncbi:MAG: trehalose-phosphatase [Thermoplasmata archaeon]
MIDHLVKFIEEKGGLTKAFLDYDGTLVNLTSDPKLAIPDEETMRLVMKIGARIPTYIITGRSLESILSLIGPGYKVIALHGAQFSDEKGNVRMVDGFERFVERSKVIASKYRHLELEFPGLRVLDKGGGVQFHYYNIPAQRIPELERVIRSIREEGFEMYSGKYIFELRISGVNKGVAIRREMDDDFVLFAGDDETDEEAFRMLEGQATVKVGDGPTEARFRLESPSEMKKLLSLIADNKLFRGD